MNTNHLLTPRQAATILKTSPRTLANWRSLESGPRFTKMPNGRVYYPDHEIRTYLESQPKNNIIENTRLIPLASLLVAKAGAHII